MVLSTGFVLRKTKWLCRETCEPDWRVIGQPFSVMTVREVDAGEAAEYAASELDIREFGQDFDSWVVGNFHLTTRYVEVEMAEGKWKRFAVMVRCKAEYSARVVREEK